MGFLIGSAFPGEYIPWSVEPDVIPVVAPSELTPPVMSAAVSEPEDQSAAQSTQTAQPGQEQEAINPKENFPLLNSACAALRAIQQRDYATLAAYVHPERGVTFTPYSTVNGESDLNFNQSQVKKFAGDTNRYIWGTVPGTGELIQMTPEEFISKYIFGADYTQASKIGIDKINISGNALENVTQAYPDCRFVDFTFPSVEASGQGQDWNALKLVFAPAQTQWYLVALIHSQWTV